jgi:uncharacterized repeat protein (TIGR01451 family)
MKTKLLFTGALFALMLTASSSLAAERYVHPASGTDGAGIVYGVTPGANTCLDDSAPATQCATIWQALQVADPGDVIVVSAGTISEGELLITKDFITLRGPNNAIHADGSTDGARVGEAEFTGTGHEFIFGIQAHNVTIEGFEIDMSASNDAWAGIRIMSGGWDRWTIQNNLIHHIDDTKDVPASGVSNFSYGIYGDAQTTTGSLTMTGGLITGNYIHTLGNSTHLTGANKSSGVGVYLEGIAGEDADCDTIDRFTCGVWIHENRFEHLFTGQNQSLQGITTPGGKEYSYGVFLAQDAQNAMPNNGAWVGGDATLGTLDNVYLDDDHLGVADPDIDLEVGVRIAIGGSTVNEANSAFNDEVIQLVINEGRKATISEIILAPWFKSLYPRVFGEGSDLYTELEPDALSLSDGSATIVQAALVGSGIDLTVKPYGESASYKVSLDTEGDFNLRFGARLLFDGPLANGVDGVNKVTLHGTTGNDLLTVDFNNGNPIPNKVAAGLSFNPFDAAFDGGFDGIALRGDEQFDYQTIVMTAPDAGVIHMEPTAPSGDEPPVGFSSLVTGGQIVFDGLEPIDDVVIVNTKFSVVAQDDVDHEINVINGPFRYGFDTFQINSGTNKTFEEINFANKKHVHIYGADDTGTAGDDVFTVFTEDGNVAPLLLDLTLWGGSIFGGGNDPDDASDDYFVIRPSTDFDIVAVGGDGETDWIFLDCANTNGSCNPGLISPVAGGSILAGAIPGFQSVTWSEMESTAQDLSAMTVPGVRSANLNIKKELVGFAVDGAHPGDDLQYKLTITNAGPDPIQLPDNIVWVTDVVDHRLTLIEQSIVTTQGSVDVTGNRNMLWQLASGELANGASATLTYTVIVNTLLTTDDVDNWASILNEDNTVDQWVTGDLALEHYAKTSLDILTVFGWPQKAAINSALFYETEAGPRYMVGLNGGAKDPSMFGMGAVLCRVPERNQEVGWDGGLGNLWYTCGEGLPNNGGIPEPLIVTDLYLDSADRIWLTTWGHSGLFYSDDGGQTWTDAQVDLSGGMGGAPDGNPDGFAQIYAITEDILGTLFISANNGDVYRSFDRGVTWQKAKQLPMGSATTAFTLEADPTRPGTLYAGTFGDSLYVTTDFAETWSRPEGNGLGSGYIFDIEIDPLSGNLFVGTAQGIYYSPNGGDDWTGLNSAFPIPTVPPEVRNIAFDSNGAFFASTWGQGVWSSVDWQADALSEFALRTGNVINMTVSNGMVNIFTSTGEVFRLAYEGRSSSVGTEDADALPTAYTLEQNYPNPFNPTTSIAFSLPESAQVSLAVYDVLGRRVATLVNGQLQAGQHSVQFEATSLPSGMYLYRLTTPSGSITQKMILLK